METIKGSKLKLCSHQKHNYKDIEVIINVKDLGFSVNEGDIIEIYHQEEDENQPRLLMQIPHYDDDIIFTKDTISVEQSIASTFQLRPYKDVNVNKVDPKFVALELLDLTFKEQYLSRSDMWRLRASLINTVTYINKKIEFCNNSIRCQAYEMWARGEKVACGVITEDTKVVFRSSTCQAYLFLQMSSEMWEFDMYGDLYFEKAVNGFLAELFTKWKFQGSNHDVTIVMFSRTYYKASSIQEFPLRMRDCLQQDFRGRFYEDFYRVAVQSDRYDDWMPSLIHLRQLFHSYRDDVLKFHDNGSDDVIPEAFNSTAMEGNFMEVLNISLNVFEKHYFDRSFERTGQMSVVITPGVGVFEVDRELTNITKQRIIDNGVGSDLVCLGEQPLHEVPLLKLSGSLKADDYSIPDTWINHSFYTSKKYVPGSNLFVPRIKVPQNVLKEIDQNCGSTAYKPPLSNTVKTPCEERGFANPLRDMDDFDNQVFKVPNNQSSRHYSSLQRTPARKKCNSHSSTQQLPQPPPPPRVTYQRKYSDSEIHQPVSVAKPTTTGSETLGNQLAKSPAINIPVRASDGKSCSLSYGNINSLNIEAGVGDKKSATQSDVEESRVGSSGANSPFENVPGASFLSRRSLINPFNLSRVPMKDTSNSRRWTHTFPKGPTGHLIQQHHYQRSSAQYSDDEDSSDISNDNVGFFGPLLPHDGGFSEDPPHNGHGLHGYSNSAAPSVVNSRAADAWAITGPASVSSSIASTKFTSSPTKFTSQYSTGLQSQYPTGIQSPTVPMGILSQATPKTTASNALGALWRTSGKLDSNTETKTGVDWKSLILPACLPLTTDYFPDEISLKNDYEVAGKYTRLPDNLDSVFLEMVSQRLSQGFQLIVRPDMGASTRHHRHNSLMRTARRAPADTYPDDVKKEHKLSIGRVFHEVQLRTSSIEVNIYRPKHPWPHLERKYNFRFRSPYLTQYEVSRGEFKTERLENFKWSTLDEYICFRGDQPECRLLEEFKYWRSRLIVVPDFFKVETKKLLEFPGNLPCDVYHALTTEEIQNATENFIRFMEVTNRLKRTGNTKKSWGARERAGSFLKGDRPRIRHISKVSDRVRMESGNKEKDDCPGPRSHHEQEEEPREEGDLRKFNQNSSYESVIEAMKDPANGVPVLSCTHTPLNPFTFLSFDATMWVWKRFDDVPTPAAAALYMQSLVDEKLVRHASGEENKPFIHGFFLYCFVSDSDRAKFVSQSFEFKMHEIAIDPCSSNPLTAASDPCSSKPLTAASDPYPQFLMPDPLRRIKLPYRKPQDDDQTDPESRGVYRVGYLVVDGSNRSDRCEEWGHLKYQEKYRPCRAFEFVLQWMCATGTLVNDLIQTWQRKAFTHGLHLFPVPTEPFVLPFTFNSNPLRSPVVIPLNVTALVSHPGGNPFEEFEPSTRRQRMYLFQESILEKFGFMNYVLERTDGLIEKSYVHVTGNMIIVISTAMERDHLPPMEGGRKDPVSNELPKYSEETASAIAQPHYLWTFNYMLSKRWKSNTSHDEAFAEKILKDFKEFCSNSNHRLKDYWNQCSSQKQRYFDALSQPFADVCMQ